MDESWDADFEGDLRVPAAVRDASGSVKMETNAAKQLVRVTDESRSILLKEPENVDPASLSRAMAIVHASVTDEHDQIYHGAVWRQCQSGNLEIAGGSIEDVLKEARDVYARLQQS